MGSYRINVTSFVYLTTLLVFSLTGISTGQSDNQTIDEVYEQFSDAYEQLDLSLIEPLYAEDAHYLVSDAGAGIKIGRDAIIRGFRQHFSGARSRGLKLRITFKIIHREMEGSFAYDVGYYKYESIPKEGSPTAFAGKFVTVLRKNSEGSWQFVVDAYSDTSVASFERAEE